MIKVDGVNISSIVNRQMNGMGESRRLVLSELVRLGRTGGRRGHLVDGAEAVQVRKVSRVHANVGKVYVAPVGEGDSAIYYYRTGAETGVADKLGGDKQFSNTDRSGSVWTLIIGRFENGKLIEPNHDNSPIDQPADEAIAA